MTGNRPILGHCPNCSEAISEAGLLIGYDTEDGSRGVWAECPVCEDVVSPE